MVSSLLKRWCNEYGKAEILLVLPVTFHHDFYLIAYWANSNIECMGLFALGCTSSFGTPYFDAEQFRLMQNILVNVRLPRILLTFMVGAALATAGNGLQALFRNPLVDSYVLGISSGAAFGAALALFKLAFTKPISLYFWCLCCCLNVFICTSKHESQTSLVMVILSGMIVSGLF